MDMLAYPLCLSEPVALDREEMQRLFAAQRQVLCRELNVFKTSCQTSDRAVKSLRVIFKYN